jgi:REP element-mobilizing transposase RayT
LIFRRAKNKRTGVKNQASPNEHGVVSRSGTDAQKRRFRRDSVPPYNPGLQKLVAGKQEWAGPLDEAAKAKGFLGWHQRGYLPHYDAPGVTQIVTLRLADSMPASRHGEWQALLQIENDQKRRRKLEAYLDLGRGECWFRQPALAQLAEEALRFFDGQRYQLAGWVVMPNHVHILVDVWDVPLTELIKSWKSFVTRKGNKLLGRGGEFWEREYLDTVIEDQTHRGIATRYVENNPVKAGLVKDPKSWRWSSARFRDERGALKYPPRSAGLQPALDEHIAGMVGEPDLAQRRKAVSRSQTGAPSKTHPFE